MHLKKILAAVCCLALAAASPAAESKLNVLHGPATAKMKGIAQIDVPVGYDFIDGDSTRALMRAYGEPTSGNELGMLMPTNANWSVIFEFNEVGYVKDDDKDSLDADKLLASIKRGTEAANKERVRAGNDPMQIVGWEQPPKYDPVTHNLEWAIRATSGGEPILNYNTRLLGRKGVMEVVLIIGPDELPAALPTFKKLLTNYSFQSGESYAEYRQGDKVAQYGLAALVVGAAGVGAAKLGLFAWLAVVLKKGWKLVVIAVAGVAVGVKKIFGKIIGKREQI